MFIRKPSLASLVESIYFMRLDVLFPIFLLVLLGLVLLVAGHNGHWSLLHLVLCMCAAITLLYVSRTRAEYLWLGALGGIALMLTPLNLGLTVTGPYWTDVICVAVFVGYYKLFVARTRMPSSGSGHGSGYRAR